MEMFVTVSRGFGISWMVFNLAVWLGFVFGYMGGKIKALVVLF